MKLENVKDDIDKFFDSLTPEELQERWKKYENNSNKNEIKIHDFLEFNKHCKPSTVNTGVCNFQKCPFTYYCFMNNEKVKCNVCGNLVGGNNITFK